MSERISPKTNLKYSLKMVCEVLGYPRSSFYDQMVKEGDGCRPKKGRKPLLSDADLLLLIQKCISESPFKGEGHRKVHARIRRTSGDVPGRNRVLKIMREHKLLSPHRSAQGKEKKHDGRITTNTPNDMWGTDAAKIFTLEDGWVWLFSVIEHWNSECLGWHLTKRGDRFAAIEALSRAVSKCFGDTSKDVARGLRLRVDHGSQFLSEGFVGQSHYWGISISKGFVKEPETNGVIERFHRTFKEQVVHGRHYHSLLDLMPAVQVFLNQYNASWLLEKLQYHSPQEARELYLNGENVLRTPISPALAEQKREARLLCFGTQRSVPEGLMKAEISPCPFAEKGGTATLFRHNTR